jgi:hypothetical protein
VAVARRVVYPDHIELLVPFVEFHAAAVMHV